jgi:hypothetical protein
MEGEGEYRVGRGRPPLHTRFQKGRSGNPAGPRRKDLPALLLAALNEKVTVNRRRMTKREAIVAGLVDQAAGVDIGATKLLIGLLKDIEKKVSPPPGPAAETRPVTRSDAAIVEGLVGRLRRMICAELPDANTANRVDPVPLATGPRAA